MQIDSVKIPCKEDVHICHTNFAKKMERNSHERTSQWKMYGKRLFFEDLQVRDEADCSCLRLCLNMENGGITIFTWCSTYPCGFFIKNMNIVRHYGLFSTSKWIVMLPTLRRKGYILQGTNIL
jgi:hypothetical protein